MTRSHQLNIAQANKKDEFYTQMKDIEAELVHYEKQFENKVVLCNCDNPIESNFSLYFRNNFHKLHLKKLICSCYNYSNNRHLQGLYSIYDGIGENYSVKHLIGRGEFDSPECIEFLKQSDIVVTNPPFSLFRKFISLLVKYNKKFLIIGNVNAISYKECFNMIQTGKMRLGYSIHAGDREFRISDDYPLDAAGYRIDEYGNKYIRVKGVRWFTNLEIKEEPSLLTLTKRYNPEQYPKFDNFNAINVGSTKDIPFDYTGIMGVPITFLDKYNSKQFEIIGNEYSLQISGGRGYVNGKRKFSRIFIKNKKVQNINTEISVL